MGKKRYWREVRRVLLESLLEGKHRPEGFQQGLQKYLSFDTAKPVHGSTKEELEGAIAYIDEQTGVGGFKPIYKARTEQADWMDVQPAPRQVPVGEMLCNLSGCLLPARQTATATINCNGPHRVTLHLCGPHHHLLSRGLVTPRRLEITEWFGIEGMPKEEEE